MPALALSLGAPQGSAWIGQPLDLRVPLSLDGADAGGSLCMQVELRQGDTAYADTNSGVQAVLEPGASPDRPLLRVRSSRPISEPVVNLRVKVGCQGGSSREFVLLADPPPVLAGMPAARAPAVTPALANASTPLASRATEPASGTRTASRTAASAAAPGAPTERAPRAARKAERPRQQQAAAAPARPPASRPGTRRAAPVAPASADAARGRLQLDALEPLPQPPLRVARWGEAGVSTLRVPLAGAGASALPGAPAASPAGSDPSATAEPAPRISPTLAEVERTTQLEAALAELRAESRQSQQTQAQLRGELADARDRRYSNPLVYVLGLLLLLLALAVWALWRASRRVPESPWAETVPREGAIRRRFKRRGAKANADAEDDDAGQAAPMYFPTTVSRRGQLSDEDEADERERERGSSDSTHGTLEERAARSAGAPAAARALDVDELLDVQQQAEFFTSLGQHDQAIEALRHYVNDHPQASALAYLELLHLYHQTQREADYEQLRQQCQQGLNVRLPGFHEFGAVGGRTLDNYPGVWARLQSHWPHPSTLEVIEELLFRHGTDDESEAFDLAAYRELLMLYALVQEQSFAAGQEWPSLDDLLRLPRRDSETPVPALAASVAGTASTAASDPFNQVLDPQRGDFQPTWPPALLDLDLERLESNQIDTIPVALRRVPAPAPATDVPTTIPLDLPELSLEPRADLPPLPKLDSTAAHAGNDPDSEDSSKGPTRAYLR